MFVEIPPHIAVAKFFAQLPDNRSYPLPQRAFQHLVAILRECEFVTGVPP
jgi:hypothetical protein